MDYTNDPFNTSFIQNITLLTSLVNNIKSVYQYVRVVFQQSGLTLSSAKLQAFVKVAPKKVTFVKQTFTDKTYYDIKQPQQAFM
jgi:hypothetical protein